MPRATRKQAALLAATAIVLLLATTPSRILGYVLPPAVQVGGFSGTLWHGQAARVALSTGGKVIHLGRLSWTLKPWSLLLLSPTVDFDAQWGQQRLKGSVRIGVAGGLTLRNVDATFDTQLIRAFLPLYIGGRIEAQMQMLRLESTAPPRVDTVAGRITWQNGVWTARSGDVALGNYVVEMAGEQGAIVGRLQTLSGPLTASGQFALEDQRYSLDVTLRGPATANDGLRTSLQLMATPVEDGFDLQLNGKL